MHTCCLICSPCTTQVEPCWSNRAQKTDTVANSPHEAGHGLHRSHGLRAKPLPRGVPEALCDV